MTQVYDLCTQVGELARFTFGVSSHNNEPPQRLNEIKQITQWVRQLKADYDIELQTRQQLEAHLEHLKSMPLRGQILTTIDLAIQEQMGTLQVDVGLGGKLLERTMNIVDNNMLILLQEIDDLRNVQSQMMIDIDSLNGRIQELQQQPVKTTEIPKAQNLQIASQLSNQTVNQISNQAAFSAIQELKKQKEQLTAKVSELSNNQKNSLQRVRALEAKLKEEETRANAAVSQLSQLSQRQHSSSPVQNSQNTQNAEKQANDRIQQLTRIQQEQNQRIALLTHENESLRLRKDYVDQVHQSKNEMANKLSETSQHIQALTAQVAAETSKNQALQNQIRQLREQTSTAYTTQPSNRGSEDLANKLVAAKAKIEQMQGRVANYQNKMIDLELINQGLTFQLDTYKGKQMENSKVLRQGRFVQGRDGVPQNDQSVDRSGRHRIFTEESRTRAPKANY